MTRDLFTMKWGKNTIWCLSGQPNPWMRSLNYNIYPREKSCHGDTYWKDRRSQTVWGLASPQRWKPLLLECEQFSIFDRFMEPFGPASRRNITNCCNRHKIPSTSQHDRVIFPFILCAKIFRGLWWVFGPLVRCGGSTNYWLFPWMVSMASENLQKNLST